MYAKMFTGPEGPAHRKGNMTRKDYEKLAAILAETLDAIRTEDRGDWGYGDADLEEEGFRRTVESLSFFLATENPRFVESKFRRACGL